jgi:hypothetical protein
VAAKKSPPPGQSAASATLAPSGCCLRPNWRRWRQLSSQAGKWVREGIKIPWLRVPKTCKRQQKKLSKEETDFLDKEVTRMLEMQAIKESDRTDLILSSIYTVPKKNGKRRPVINLRWVNEHIETIHFKMSTMKDVKQAMRKGDYLASLDLTDCFWGLPLSEKDQRACAFHWRGKNYVFTCLPFGLSLSPLFITKLYRNVVEHLQARGHRVIMYIDDILILGETRKQCADSVQAVRDCLAELGARINAAKSQPTPTQRLEYLGFELDTKAMKIWTPKKKLLNTKKALKSFLRSGTATAREAASVLGKLNSLADALLSARVHTAETHDFKLAAQRHGWDHATQIPKAAIDELNWWLRHLQALNGRSIHPPAKDFDAGTDASDFGWGCWIRTAAGLQRWGGHFDAEEAKLHINFKEMLAVKYFLQSCPVDLRGKTVDIGIDNTTTLWYLMKYGGRKTHLANLSAEIFDITRTRETVLIGHHCPGLSNTIADQESRRTTIDHLSDLQLNPQLFLEVEKIWGPHSIDLFASFQDRLLPRYSSREPQPGTQWIDALTRSWTDENAWANPPFAMIFRVLHKVKQEGSTVTLLAPFWPSQPWFPLLLSMLVDAPVLLPRVPGQFRHPLLRSGKTPQWLTLAWRISGDSSALNKSARRLSRRFSKPGSRRLTRTTTSIGVAGLTSPRQQDRIQELKMSLFWHRGWQD